MATKVTCQAPVNIAFIKYWGKKDEELITPINDSYSITLSTATFCSTTTVELSPDFEDDTLMLNGESVDVSKSTRLQNVFRKVREECPESLRGHKVRAESSNNFPTAAGMASSASGLCCLAFTLSKAFGIPDDKVCVIARLGSGSACRSVYGGFVKWHEGEREDGEDSIAEQCYPASHWPEMQVVVCVAKGTRKETPSTAGMQQSVLTSKLLKEKRLPLLPAKIDRVDAAIRDRDFETFAEITMQDSDELRAVCLDTNPPIDYWSDHSIAVRKYVEDYNGYRGRKVVAVSNDAGPNPFFFMLKGDADEVLSDLFWVYPTKRDLWSFEDAELCERVEKRTPSDAFKAAFPQSAFSFESVFHCNVGNGPHVVEN